MGLVYKVGIVLIMALMIVMVLTVHIIWVPVVLIVTLAAFELWFKLIALLIDRKKRKLL